MHQQPVFEGYDFYGSGVSDYLFEHGLCLPSGSSLTDNDFERIFGALNEVLSARLEEKTV
jgi:dTDP-4-amino-4,6-dideoxygalactose transaminase